MPQEKKRGSEKMWGGRFSETTAASMEAYSESISYDSRLYRYDIAGSKAHATMLAANGILSDEELEKIITGLSEIEAEIDAGTFKFKVELEDVHMNIEKALIDRIGPAGARLHSGRSRNDQVAVDFKMYLRDQCDFIVELLDGVRAAFVKLARWNLGAAMPGYTHMQRAQPVLISHHMLAYFEMFSRDRGRMKDCRRRLNLSPLGSAAMAGTGLPIDREMTAKALGFESWTRNSMDSSGDRDYALEFLSTCTMIHLHLSRLSEELVLWSTSEFDFVDLPDKFCTGSSIMPQKKNPDIVELMRGKTGRVVGSLMTLITIMKGLPLTYNRDLQEDKEPVFDAADTVTAGLSIIAELLADLKFKKKRTDEATRTGCMTATDLADYLVLHNVPFREAHAIVGHAVAWCLDHGKELPDLTLEEMAQFSPVIGKDVYEVLSTEGSINSRISRGGTSLVRVEEAVATAEKELGIQA
jgi:argininosuccinate lyase